LTEPRWIQPEAVLIFHAENLLEFGGMPGIREEGAIESALAPSRNLVGYGEPDLYALAASYTAGLCQNHGFVDGNKRTAFITGYVFLADIGISIQAEQAEVVAAMLALADHTIDEDGYGAWLRDHSSEGISES